MVLFCISFFFRSKNSLSASYVPYIGDIQSSHEQHKSGMTEGLHLRTEVKRNGMGLGAATFQVTAAF